MAYRTDLALETIDTADGKLPEGVDVQESDRERVHVTAVCIQSEGAARRLGKAPGTYITLELENLAGGSIDVTDTAQVMAGQLAPLLPEGPVLVVGLGNRAITPDALGPSCAEKILATRHIPGDLSEQIGLGRLRPVAAIAPGVMGQTGVESSEVVGALVDSLRPAAVIAVDALASRSVSRLGNTIQLSDGGVSPGAGVLNHRKELSRHTLGVPVISIGVPTVVDGLTIARELSGAGEEGKFSSNGEENMMVTPRDVDLLIEKGAAILALGINLALHPSLSAEDLLALTSSV